MLAHLKRTQLNCCIQIGDIPAVYTVNIPVDKSSMFPGLLYSDEIESKRTVPRVLQDSGWNPQTDMKEDSLTFETLDEGVTSCNLVLVSSSFVRKSSSWLSLRSLSNTKSLFSKSLSISSNFLLFSSTACSSFSNCALKASGWALEKRQSGWGKITLGSI